MSSRALPSIAVACALALGVWAHKPALYAGFWSDDYLQSAMLRGAYPSPRAALDLFRFADGSAEDTRRLLDFGYYPWWTHEGFQLSMLRPLASVGHALDFTLLPGDAYAQHLVSFAWWGALVIAVAGLLFALLPRAAAACAVLMFALDESGSVPLVWLSNRSALMATAFGALALWQHVRWRKRGGVLARAASIVSFALALASGEYALVMFAYLLGLEVFTPGSGVSRVRALAPALTLCALFALIWVGFGYGSAHSGLYTNPLRSPRAYAQKVVTGVPVLAGDLVLGLPADMWTLGPLAQTATKTSSDAALDALPPEFAFHSRQVAFGVFALLLTWLLVRILGKRLEGEHAAHLRALVGAALFGLLPVLGSFISTRLVLPASIGFSALFGCALSCAGSALWNERKRVSVRALGLLACIAAIVFVHGVHAWHISRDATEWYSDLARRSTGWALSADIDDRRAGGVRAVVIATQDVNAAAYLPFVRFANGHPLLRGLRVLSGSSGRHQLTRIDARTLEVTPLGVEGAAASVVGSLTRSDRELMHAGEFVALDGMQVHVLETAAGQPSRMRFTFDVALDDQSLLWLQSTSNGLEPLALPAIGQTSILPAPARYER